MRRHVGITVAIGALLLGACGGGDEPTLAEGTSTTTPEPTGTASSPGAGGSIEVGTAATDLGTVLVDGEGRTLYVFDDDSEGESSCYGGCAESWPPLTGGEASASGDVDPALLGTTERDDGSIQVTYAGAPLYRYAADTAPGDTEGQGVGDVWWVVDPEGERITGGSAARTPDADDYDY